MSARSADSCGSASPRAANAFREILRFARRQAIYRLAIAKTERPHEAKPVASPVPTRGPAPMKPSVNFFGRHLLELYESREMLSLGRQTISDIGSTPAGTARVYRVVSEAMEH